MKTPKDEFIDLITENVKTNGLDELSARIIAVLFLEPNEISLEDLASKIGYSLSSISTAIKFMEATGLINKFKKPHSKKIYLKMENDITEILINMLRKKQQFIIKHSKDTLPGIIEKYKKTKSSKQELKIIEHYYHDILSSEKIIDELIAKIKKFKRN